MGFYNSVLRKSIPYIAALGFLSNIFSPNYIEAKDLNNKNKVKVKADLGFGITNLRSEDFQQFNGDPGDITTRLSVGAEYEYGGFGFFLSHFRKTGDSSLKFSGGFLREGLESATVTLKNLSFGFYGAINLLPRDGKVVPYISFGLEDNILTTSNEDIFVRYGFFTREGEISSKSRSVSVYGYLIGSGIVIYPMDSKDGRVGFFISGSLGDGIGDNENRRKSMERTEVLIGIVISR